MKKIPLFLKTFLIVFIFSAIPHIATAQNTYQSSYPIAAYLLDYAKKLYAQGDFENAKHEFSKLLIIDPDNKEAREYLKKIGLDKGLYRSTGRLGLEEGSIYNENLSLRKQNEESSAVITGLKQEIVRKSARIKSLEDEIKSIACQAAESGIKIGALENLVNAKNQAITNLHAELGLVKIEGDLRLSARERQLREEVSGSERLNAQVEEYAKKVCSLEDALASKEKELAILNAELESYRQSSQKWQDIKERELKDKTYALKKLKDESDALRQQLVRAEGEILEKDARLADFKGQLNGLRGSLQEKEFEAAGLSQSLKEKTDLANRLLQKDSEVSEILSGLSSLKDNLVRAEAGNLAKEEQLRQLEGVKVKLQGENDSLLKELEAKSAQIEEAGQKIDKLMDALQAQEMEIAALKSEFKQQEYAADKRLSEKENELAARYAGIEELNLKLEAVRNQLAQLEKEKSDKESWIEHLESQIKKLEETSRGQLTKYLEKLNSLEDSLRAKDKESQELQNSFKSEREKLQTELSSKEVELAEKSARIEELNNQLNSRDEQLSIKEQQGKVEADEVSRLQDKIKQLGMESAKQLGEYLEKLNGLQDSLKAKARDVEALSSEFDSYKQQLAGQLSEKDKQLVQQASEIGQLKIRTAELNNKLIAAEGALSAKEKELAGQSAKAEGLDNKLKEFSGQLDEYKNLLSTSENFLGAKDNALADLNSQLAAREQALKEKDARTEELNNQLDLAMEQLAQLEQKLKEQDSVLGGQIAGYDDKLNKLKESIQAREKELEDTTIRVGDLLRQKEELEAEANQQILSLQATMDKLQQSLRSEIDDYKAKLEMAERSIVVTVLTDIAFDSGKAEILPEGKKILDKISEALKDISPDNHIVIEGHTDNVPIRYSGWKSNWELSTARALSVLHHLIDAGDLSPERFSANGYGEHRPVTDNDTELGKRQNRRVEIVIQPPKIIKAKSVEAPSAEDNTGAGVQGLTPAPKAVSF